MTSSRIRRIGCAALLLIGLAACGQVDSQPMTYTDISDMGSGPGLFTGKEGAFVLYQEGK